MDVEARRGELAHADFTEFLLFLTVVWKLLLATSIFQICSLWLVKFALISVYAEFFRLLSVRSQRLLWATGVLTVLSFFSIIFLFGYWCPLVELEKIP